MQGCRLGVDSDKQGHKYSSHDQATTQLPRNLEGPRSIPEP